MYNITELLKQKIREKGMSISDVAERLWNDREKKKGVSQQSLSLMLSRNIPFNRVAEIANIIGIPLSEILSEADGGCAKDFLALVRHDGMTHTFTRASELKAFAEKL